MDVIDLIYQLKRAGHTQVSLARELGVTRSVINDVIHGRGPSFRVATYIADVISTDVEILWPGRYRRPLLRQHFKSHQPKEKEESQSK